MTRIEIKNVADFIKNPGDYTLRMDTDEKTSEYVISEEHKYVRPASDKKIYDLSAIVKELPNVKDLCSHVFIALTERIVIYNKQNQNNQVLFHKVEEIFHGIYEREYRSKTDCEEESIYCALAITCELKALFENYRSSDNLVKVRQFQELFKKQATTQVVNVADTLMEGENLLHFIIKCPDIHDIFLEHSQIFELLADLQADFNKQCATYGNTPFMWAVANANNTVAMKMLHVVQTKKINLQLNLLDKCEKKTALHFILAKGYRKKNCDGKPLRYSNLQLAAKVIEMQADVNSQDAFGNTPLHIACLRRDDEAIALLLKSGAKDNLLNKENKRPQEMLSTVYETAIRFLNEYTTCSFELNKQDYEHSLERSQQLFTPLVNANDVSK